MQGDIYINVAETSVTTILDGSNPRTLKGENVSSL